MTSTEFRSVIDRYVTGRPAAEPARTPTLDIAVVGMAGRFPGSDDVRGFWDNLVAGRKCVGELPPEILGGNGRGYRWGGVINERDCFDPEFFGIDPREADSMNLHQRLLLEEAWHALEDAGIDPTSLTGSDTGMFVGAEPSGYLHESFTGASDALVATRLSYLLDWHGPALVVNTACSSSIVAIHLAAQSLNSGECGVALAAGVNAGLSQEPLNLLADMGVLSPSGECRTFDNSSNGTVFAEGVAVLVLKRLADAEAAGDDILGVIRATGINQDGASNGITAPNGLAQERLIEAVYQRFGIETSRIGYIEAHGTATALGDSVEAGALARVFGRHQPHPAGCLIGTAKASVGHTGAAAGAIGLIKVLLSMRNERFTGLPTFRTLNRMIRLGDSGLTIDAIGTAWPDTPGMPRMAAVNSMGHSGTNAHLVVEEYPGRSAARTEPTGPIAIPLSARDRERLRELAGRLADHLDRACASDAADGDLVRGTAADVLGVAPDEIRLDRSLEEQGAEPHQLARLAVLLSRQTGREVTVDTLYEARTVRELSSSLGGNRSTAGRRAHREPPSLADVALTLQQGRAALDDRAVILAGSMPQLIAALRALAAGTPTPDTILGGSGGSGDGTVRAKATIWSQGGTVEWPSTGGRRVSLPGYPFARIRHGKDRLAPRDPAAATAPAPAPIARPTAPATTPGYGPVAAPAPSATVSPIPAPVPAVSLAAEEPAAEEPAAEEPAAVAGPGRLHDDIAQWLTSIIAARVGVAPEALDRWERFDAYGIDSVARTKVNQCLAEHFSSASRTLLFEFATIDEVASLLATDFPAECRNALREVAPAGTEPPPAGGTEVAPVDVTGWLSTVVAQEADIDPAAVDPWQAWDTFGIDSVIRTRVNHRIAEAFPDASRTLLFEFGSVGEVAQSLAEDFPVDAAALGGTPAPAAQLPAWTWPATPTWMAPFPARETGFSASRTLLDPSADPEDTELVRDHQAELLDVLLHGEDLTRVSGLLDMSAGPGAAGLRLAARYPNLRVCVRTSGPEQADAALRAAKERGLDARVTVAQGDPVPAGPYEVALGIEGSHLVPDQPGYLAATAAALPEGGRLLLADFSGGATEIADRRIGVTLPTRERWADLLADAGFRITGAVDASVRVGHFLADYDVDQNTVPLDPAERDRWRFRSDLAIPLERGAAAYLVLRLTKDTATDPAARRADNRFAIAAPTDYAEAVTGR